MAVSAPDAASGIVGTTRWSVADRTLTLSAPAGPIRLGAFRGPGTASQTFAGALGALSEHRPNVVFVLGGLGASAEVVAASLHALAALPFIVVVIPGGDDPAEIFGEAIDEARTNAPNLFDGRRLRQVVLGGDTFALLSGAPNGRYALDGSSCGNHDEDRAELEASDHGRTWLVSWAAPAGGGVVAVGRGFEGVDAGDPRVTQVMRRIGAAGGIFAWPATRVSLPTNAAGEVVLAPGVADASFRIVANRLVGPAVERDDTALAPPGALLLELSAAGLTLVGTTAGESE